MDCARDKMRRGMQSELAFRAVDATCDRCPPSRERSLSAGTIQPARGTELKRGAPEVFYSDSMAVNAGRAKQPFRANSDFEK